MGLAGPSRVSPLVLHTQSESGGMRRLNPRRKINFIGRKGDRERRLIEEEVPKRRKCLARKQRRRGRAEGHLVQQQERRNRARARRRKITVATHNARTMAVDGTHGVGRAIDILSLHDRLECDAIGLQEIRLIQPSSRLDQWYIWCTAVVGAVTRMVGKKGQVE